MNFTLVGAFVLALGAALIAVVLWLASGGAWQTKYDLYLAQEDESVAGLNLNAPVKYNGVDVGKVRQIHLDANNPDRVNLLFAIERGTPIKEDTVAVLKTQGLTGIAYVELSGGSVGSPPLVATVEGEIPTIRSKPSLIARLEDRFNGVLATLDRTGNNVNAVLDTENRAALKQILADTAALTGALAAQKASLSAGIANAARTASNTARASEQLAPLIARIGNSAEAVEKMANEAARASASAGRAVDAVGSGVKQFNSEALPELERLLVEMNALAASLRRLSEQTERDPSSLLLGNRNPSPGPGEKAKP